MSDRKQLTLTLPLEPAFGYGTRQPTSDGFISRKDSISINAPSAAGAFAYIGAARYLRAQRTKGAVVLLISPRFTDLLVKPGAVGRRLSSLSTDVEQAIYGNWLASWRRDHAHSRGLAVHLVQTQGAKQSISVNRIELSFDPLNRLAASNCRKLIWRWERQLEANAGNLTEYIDTLLSLLHSFDRDSIYRHLTETARYHQSASESTPEYELEEIKAMIGLYPDTKSSMAQVINRTNGTARFGRAIRLLSEQNRSVVREILEDLEAVRSQDQLLRVLARAQQKFVLAKASTDFIVIPTEEDLAVLLDDIAQFGATEIAGLLIILATVRYPKVADQPNATPSSAPTDTTTTNPTQEENQNYVSQPTYHPL